MKQYNKHRLIFFRIFFLFKSCHVKRFWFSVWLFKDIKDTQKTFESAKYDIKKK